MRLILALPIILITSSTSVTSIDRNASATQPARLLAVNLAKKEG